MRVRVFCQSGMRRDLFVAALKSAGIEFVESSSSMDEIELVRDDDVVVFWIEGTDFALQQIRDALERRPHMAAVVVCPRSVLHRARREIGGVVSAVVPENLTLDAIVGSILLVDQGYRLVPDDAGSVPDGTAPGDGNTGAARPEKQARFSEREVAVLHYLRHGISNKDIAKRMGISDATVKVHLRSVFRKARVKNRTQAALWAGQNLDAGGQHLPPEQPGDH